MIRLIEAQFERIIITIQIAKGGWSSHMGSMVSPDNYEKAPAKLGEVSLYLPKRMLKDFFCLHIITRLKIIFQRYYWN